MPSASNGPGASPADPDHPTHAPSKRCMTGFSALTSPPGLVRHRVEPSAESTRSTGSRFATTTKPYPAPDPGVATARMAISCSSSGANLSP